MTTEEQFANLCQQICDEAILASVQRSYALMVGAHGDKLYESGKRFVEHCLNTAAIVWEWTRDAELSVAALLHHILDERTTIRTVNHAELAYAGADVIALVEETGRLSRVRQELQQQGVFKELARLLEASYDVRVVLIKLASALEVVRGLAHFQDEQEKRSLARFKLDAYSLTASRLGMWQVKHEIENRCLEILFPEQYRAICQVQAEAIEANAELIASFQGRMRERCQQAGIAIDLDTQPSGIYDQFQYLRGKKRLLDLSPQRAKWYLKLADLHNQVILTPEPQDCYRLLGLAHELGQPLSNRFYDYISTPKSNGYAALHTRIAYRACGRTAELRVLIRTHAMNAVARHGITAPGLLVAWRRRFALETAGPASQDEPPPKFVGELLNSFAQPMHQKESITVFSRDADQVRLVAGATPLDFAYAIHTELGNQYDYALVNGQNVAMTYQLQDGDLVEIFTHRNAAPELRWLDIAVTRKARQKIREWLNQAPRQQGYDDLVQELETQGLEWSDVQVQVDLERIAKAHFDSVDRLLEEIGAGRISAALVVRNLLQTTRVQLTFRRVILREEVLQQLGMQRPWVRLAKCCNPSYPNQIIGCVRQRTITVHKARCGNAGRADRRIPVEWEKNPNGDLLKVTLQIEGFDRIGLMRDIAAVVANRRLNMCDLRAEKTAYDRFSFAITIELPANQVPERLLSDLRSIDGILNVRVAGGLALETILDRASHTRSFATGARAHKLDEIPNPYSPGRPIQQKQMFFGRIQEQRAILGFLLPADQPTCVMLCAQRRTGKTSLAWRIHNNPAIEREYVSAFVDLSHLTANDDYSVLRYISRYLHRQTEKLAFEFKPLQSLRTNQDPYERFEEKLEEFSRQTGKRILLILDEFEALLLSQQKGVLSDRFFQALRSWAQRQPIALFIIGSLDLHTRLGKSFPQFSNVFLTDPLGPLQADAARELIIRPAQGILEYEHKVIEQTLALSGGHPYYIHLVCAKLFSNATSRYRMTVTQHDLDQVIDDLTNYTSSSYYAHFWSSQEPLQQRLLAAIAYLSENVAADDGVEADAITRLVVGEIGQRDEGALSLQLNTLVGLCVLQRWLKAGEMVYRFQLPLFQRWILYNWPYPRGGQ